MQTRLDLTNVINDIIKNYNDPSKVLLLIRQCLIETVGDSSPIVAKLDACDKQQLTIANVSILLNDTYRLLIQKILNGTRLTPEDEIVGELCPVLNSLRDFVVNLSYLNRRLNAAKEKESKALIIATRDKIISPKNRNDLDEANGSFEATKKSLPLLEKQLQQTRLDEEKKSWKQVTEKNNCDVFNFRHQPELIAEGYINQLSHYLGNDALTRKLRHTLEELNKRKRFLCENFVTALQEFKAKYECIIPDPLIRAEVNEMITVFEALANIQISHKQARWVEKAKTKAGNSVNQTNLPETEAVILSNEKFISEMKEYDDLIRARAVLKRNFDYIKQFGAIGPALPPSAFKPKKAHPEIPLKTPAFRAVSLSVAIPDCKSSQYPPTQTAFDFKRYQALILSKLDEDYSSQQFRVYESTEAVIQRDQDTAAFREVEDFVKKLKQEIGLARNWLKLYMTIKRFLQAIPAKYQSEITELEKMPANTSSEKTARAKKAIFSASYYLLYRDLTYFKNKIKRLDTENPHQKKTTQSATLFKPAPPVQQQTKQQKFLRALRTIGKP